MRIQHNITAMNSYRNFSTNNSQLSKNLEKLSSGYKINRAGDDAAGLAISEKMRAQITGLTGAKKNATDGISLIQTAEGALTEVHSMLNRMVTLTEQSANGTYDNDVDRAQLQKEVESLKTEINRVADSTNFNGLKLLDGSLAVRGVDANLSANVDATKTLATSNTYKSGAAVVSAADKAADGAKLTYTVAWQAEDGQQYSRTVNLTQKLGSTLNTERNLSGSQAYTADSIYLESDDGTVYTADGNAGGVLQAGGNIKLDSTEKALAAELNKDDKLTASFDVKFQPTATTGYTAHQLQFTAKTKGADGAQITASQLSQYDSAGATEQTFFATAGATALNTQTTYNGKDVEQKLDLSNVAVLAGVGPSAGAYTADVLKKAVFEVEGKKFAIVGHTATSAGLQNLDQALAKNGYDDVTVINLASTASTQTGNDDGTVTYNSTTQKAVDSQTISAALSRATGEDYTAIDGATVTAAMYTNTDGNALAANSTAADGDIYYRGSETLTNISTKVDGKLTLQIGDTSDDYNKMSINVADMHTDAMGIDDVDISTQEGAAAAMDKIKAAVNYVSDARGGLGALQNRLDHTINNLGVMTENIQSAESAIRDTDVAEEMMNYTKNNILNQSAQAMLAQANQLPQGVLQLLG